MAKSITQLFPLITTLPPLMYSTGRMVWLKFNPAWLDGQGYISKVEDTFKFKDDTTYYGTYRMPSGNTGMFTIRFDTLNRPMINQVYQKTATGQLYLVTIDDGQMMIYNIDQSAMPISQPKMYVRKLGIRGMRWVATSKPK